MLFYEKKKTEKEKEIENLKKEIEYLKKENRVLKDEAEKLKEKYQVYGNLFNFYSINQIDSFAESTINTSEGENFVSKLLKKNPLIKIVKESNLVSFFFFLNFVLQLFLFIHRFHNFGLN